MAKKRPLVVSFRRIQKMTPTSAERSVSICDIHRLDTSFKDNNEVMTMKIMSKYGANPLRCSLLRRGFCGENHSCRSHASNDKQKSRLDSLFDERTFEAGTSDKGCVFPKEKFYGNAQLLLTMNDDILRKAVTDCNDNSYERHVDTKYNFHRKLPSANRLTMDASGRQRNRLSFKNNLEFNKDLAYAAMPADNEMIDGDGDIQCCKAATVENDYLSNREKSERQHLREKKNISEQEPVENETPSKAFAKSSSFPISFHVAQYSLGVERAGKAQENIRKSVSTLSVNVKASNHSSTSELLKENCINDKS